MKYCEEYAALLDLYVDGELSPEEMAAVQEHLDQCPDCRRYVDEILEIRAAFPDVEETPVPAGFADGVMEAIRAASPAPGKTARRKTGRRWIKVLAPLAACIAVAVLVTPLQPWEHSRQEAAQVAQDVAAEESVQAEPQTEPASGDSASGEISPKQFGAAATETEPQIAADIIPEEAPANTRQNPVAEQASEPAPEQNPASAGTQAADSAENGAAANKDETAQEQEPNTPGSVTAATTGEPISQDASEEGGSQQEQAVGPSASVYIGEEGTDAWVAYDNVVFAQVAFLTREEVGEALEGYTGKPYSDAQRPEEGVLGTGYAMELEEYQRILETAGKSSLETQANPDRTTEQCCIVVLSAEG